MKALVSIWCVLVLTANADMAEIRTAFHRLDSEDKVEGFIKKYGESTLQKSVPYVAAAVMQRAKYVFMPTKKLVYFKQGKKKLEAYIKAHPDDVEARYVRALVQSQIPGILGYKDNIESDKEFVIEHLASSGLPEAYQGTILTNLKKIP